MRGIDHKNRVVNLSIAGASLKEINTLEGFHQGTVGKHVTRMQIWRASSIKNGIEWGERNKK